MNYFADQSALIAIKNIPGGPSAIYTTLKSTIPGFQFFSVFYNSVLNKSSRDKLNDFRSKNFMLKQLHTKITILIEIIKTETMTPKDFLSVPENMTKAKEYLSMIGIVDVSPEKIPELINQVNGHINDIIGLIEKNKNPFDAIFNKLSSVVKLPLGGKRTKRMKRKKSKKTKSGGDYSMLYLPFMSQNEINFKLWNKDKPEIYKTYNPELYYPNPYNILSRSGVPISWTERVKKHCNNKTTISGSSLMGECVKKYCSTKQNHPSCKNNDQYGIRLF